MSQLDSKVAAVIDSSANATEEVDEDDLIASLEQDSNSDAFRERRIQQLHEEFTRAKQLRTKEHGTYVEIKDEKSLMDITTSSRLCVVHFFKPDFNRCRIMETHLEKLAERHLDTRFLSMNVDNAPFLVVKLKVQVLPCVLAFVEGVGVDRVVGFEGLGRGTDNFTTKDLEERLLQCKVLLRPIISNLSESQTQNKTSKRQDKDDSDDDDWD